MRLTFVAPPFAGHFNPLLVLAKAARDAGHEVEFISGPRKHAVLEANQMAAPVLVSIGPDTLEGIANSGEQVGSNPVRLLRQFRQNLRLLPAIGKELEERWRARRPDVVIADSVAPVAGLVCERLGIPWITTIATPFSIETRHGTPSYCGGWTPGNTAFRDAAGRLIVRGFKRFVGLVFRAELAALGLKSIYRADGSEAIYSPYAILGFGLRELEFERDWPAQFEMIGPVIDAPEAASALEIGSTRPRVLVTHGTHLLWAKRTLVEEVVALSETLPEMEFLVSLGESRRATEAPAKAAARVIVYPFVSYQPVVLRQFDAIIHHGGAGVTYAAIFAGIPSLVVPRDYDQFDYAARIVHHGLGLRATSIKGCELHLKRLPACEQWPALKTFEGFAKSYNPETRFLEILEAVVQRY